MRVPANEHAGCRSQMFWMNEPGYLAKPTFWTSC